MQHRGTLAVVGGGVIGLSVARRAALDGWTVRVHRTPRDGCLLGGRWDARPAQRGLAR
jgi:glycine/D-amino acid oxidase-like deaminating enzyme